MNHFLKTAKVIDSKFLMRSGVPVENIRFNAMLNVWLGTVSGIPHAWDSDGKCIDRGRPDLDLFSFKAE